MGRCISSNKIRWGYFGFSLHECHCPIAQLSEHLKNEQRMYFIPENAVKRGYIPIETFLTTSFKGCCEDDIPVHFF